MNYWQNKNVHERGQNVLKEQMGFFIYKRTLAIEWNNNNNKKALNDADFTSQLIKGRLGAYVRKPLNNL